MQIFDSHTHLDFDEFNSDRNITIERAINAGISHMIVSSTIAKRWQLISNICDEYKVCHPAYGLHPMFMHQHCLANSDNDLTKLKTWLQTNPAIAIGEIGLDFFIDEADEQNRKAQLDLFITQLEIAEEFALPVIIHARKSLDIVLKQLRKFPTVTGSIHSFSGSVQQANLLVDLGFYLSFGGPITYDRATRLHKLIKEIPLDALLVETDSPDQPDNNHHKQRNEPAFIVNVLEKIAELKQIDIEHVANKTHENAMKLFNLNPS